MARAPDAAWRWLGRVPFAETVELQEQLRRDILAGHAPETLLLCEHDPVITLGRSARAAHVLASPDELRRRGVAVHAASRGGDVTYHGPGQLVGYPILRLRQGVVAHLTTMARGLSTLLAELGIEAVWRRDTPGLWVTPQKKVEALGAGAAAPLDPPSAKICAFGVHVQHRVAIHGFALNVTTPPTAFDLIVPCGLNGAVVTSVLALAGSAPSLESFAARAAASLARAYALPFTKT
jgi:lipoyl(octanoyl) transferase